MKLVKCSTAGILIIGSLFTPLTQVKVLSDDGWIDIKDNFAWDAVKWIWGLFDKDGVAVAQASSVEIDTVEGYQKGWYADEDWYDHVTIKNGYESAPESTLNGVSTTSHIIHERQFEFYDVVVFQEDPVTHQLSNGALWVGENYWEPTVYLSSDSWHVAIGTSRKFDATYRVFSVYGNTTADQGLRVPGNYTVNVHYKLADLAYGQNGLTTTPRALMEKKAVQMSAIDPDNKNVDLLTNKTEMYISPWATGKITRDWQFWWTDENYTDWSPITGVMPNGFASSDFYWDVRETIEP